MGGVGQSEGSAPGWLGVDWVVVVVVVVVDKIRWFGFTRYTTRDGNYLLLLTPPVFVVVKILSPCYNRKLRATEETAL